MVHGYAPKGLATKSCTFFIVRFEEDVLAGDPVKSYKCLWFSEDLLAFHFTDSGIENANVVLQGILEYGIVYVEVEEGTGRVHEEWYEKTMLLVLDESDTMTPTEGEVMVEKGDEGESEQEEVSTTRSRRARKRVQGSNFVFI